MDGNEIRARRERAGISRASFARGLGVDPATLYRWEHDQAQPRGLYRERLESELRRLERPPPRGPDGGRE